MDVTEAQEIALKSMFQYWNSLSNVGSSRYVAFFVDGDGNFHPRVTVDGEKPEVEEELRKLSITEDEDGHRKYDFDSVAWHLRSLHQENQ